MKTMTEMGFQSMELMALSENDCDFSFEHISKVAHFTPEQIVNRLTLCNPTVCSACIITPEQQRISYHPNKITT